MDEKQIHINIHNSNNNHNNSGQISTPQNEKPKHNDKKFKTQYVIIPIVLAVITATTAVVVAKINKPDNPVETKISNCTILIDSMKNKKTELNFFLINGDKKNYDKFVIDSIVLEQSIYDISQQIKNNKCGQ